MKWHFSQLEFKLFNLYNLSALGVFHSAESIYAFKNFILSNKKSHYWLKLYREILVKKDITFISQTTPNKNVYTITYDYTQHAK